MMQKFLVKLLWYIFDSSPVLGEKKMKIKVQVRENSTPMDPYINTK